MKENLHEKYFSFLFFRITLTRIAFKTAAALNTESLLVYKGNAKGFSQLLIAT